MRRQPHTPEILNRKAFHEYEILEKYISGIVLTGTEIKSIREGRASIVDAYCYVRGGELWVKGMYIAPYEKAGHNTQHDPYRDRKLLLRSAEIDRLVGRVQEKGLTVVPLRVFISERGWAKVEIALVRGRKLHDKREVLRRKAMEREAMQELKRHR